MVGSVWFKVAIAVAVIGLLVHFNRIDFALLPSFTEAWPWLVAAFILTLPPFWIVSLRFKVILASQGIDVTFRQAFRWTMVGGFFDLAMPSSNGGDLIKATYVISYVGAGLRARALMAVAFDRVIGLLGLFILATIAGMVGWGLLKDLPTRNLVVGMSFALGVGPLIAFRIAGSRRLYNSPHINQWTLAQPWGARLKQLIGSFNALRERPSSLATALALSVLNHTFWCVSLIFIAKATGNSVPAIKGFAVFPLAISGGILGVAGGFGLGTAAFDFLLLNLLAIQNGAMVGLLFQIMGAAARLLGLPFFLAAHAADPLKIHD